MEKVRCGPLDRRQSRSWPGGSRSAAAGPTGPAPPTRVRARKPGAWGRVLQGLQGEPESQPGFKALERGRRCLERAVERGSPAATAGHRSLGVPGPFGAELLEQSPSIALGPHGGLLQCPPQSPGLSRPARRGAGGARGVPRLQLRRVVWAARPLPCARPCLLLRLFGMQSRSQLAGHLDAGSSARPGRDAGGKPRARAGLPGRGAVVPAGAWLLGALPDGHCERKCWVSIWGSEARG